LFTLHQTASNPFTFNQNNSQSSLVSCDDGATSSPNTLLLPNDANHYDNWNWYRIGDGVKRKKKSEIRTRPVGNGRIAYYANT